MDYYEKQANVRRIVTERLVNLSQTHEPIDLRYFAVSLAMKKGCEIGTRNIRKIIQEHVDLENIFHIEDDKIVYRKND